MTIPTSGWLGLDRIKVELAMDGLNPPANDINNGWFRLLANRQGDRQPIDFGAFRGRGCRFDGNAGVYDPGGTGEMWQFDPRMPFFNATLASLQMVFQRQARRYDALVEMWGDPGTRVPIFVQNATTGIAYRFTYSGDGTYYYMNNVDGNFMRYGSGDWFMIVPDMR
ncbi:hypothetical protein BcepIL02_gp60 [Burkholderia phage BcepIL02]|uniref:Uncharacterized protein n=1 Tax=Burkholderia phage BcepIL02 TaxID=2886898 RepID=C5IHQ2_9CAUD|nr:hypothetical protein BcepIL02_gp60 [Burkholderia phage BcepIL02]ACR15053.1 hypothetical protein BcepIL02_gp60 [Burkholderia phage BcepIL02]